MGFFCALFVLKNSEQLEHKGYLIKQFNFN